MNAMEVLSASFSRGKDWSSQGKRLTEYTAHCEHRGKDWSSQGKEVNGIHSPLSAGVLALSYIGIGIWMRTNSFEMLDRWKTSGCEPGTVSLQTVWGPWGGRLQAVNQAQ
ncbi:hypothetical protein ACOMHN_003238 [Nucella lapillus]